VVDPRSALEHGVPLRLPITRLVHPVLDKDLADSHRKYLLDLGGVSWHLLALDGSTIESENLLLVLLLLNTALLKRVAELEGPDHDTTHLGHSGGIERGREGTPDEGEFVDDPYSDFRHDLRAWLDVLGGEDADSVDGGMGEVDVVHGDFDVREGLRICSRVWWIL
jgi:hypothetical protein